MTGEYYRKRCFNCENFVPDKANKNVKGAEGTCKPKGIPYVFVDDTVCPMKIQQIKDWQKSYIRKFQMQIKLGKKPKDFDYKSYLQDAYPSLYENFSFEKAEKEIKEELQEYWLRYYKERINRGTFPKDYDYKSQLRETHPELFDDYVFEDEKK